MVQNSKPLNLSMPVWLAEYMQDVFLEDEIRYWITRQDDYSLAEQTRQLNDLYDLLKDIRVALGKDISCLERGWQENLAILKEQFETGSL
ncbi:MAG: hypothetical protein HS126_40350 [Anaerolineales bacterium]|nr:hypothetical protein [Anaerolineales bacterium]